MQQDERFSEMGIELLCCFLNGTANKIIKNKWYPGYVYKEDG